MRWWLALWPDDYDDAHSVSMGWYSPILALVFSPRNTNCLHLLWTLSWLFSVEVPSFQPGWSLKVQFWPPKLAILGKNGAEICFCCFFTGGSYRPKVNVSELHFVWPNFARPAKIPKYRQIKPNTAKYCNWPVSGRAKYGWVGYPWKGHTKWGSDTLTSGR